MATDRAIPHGFMTVGEVAKKMALPFARCNITTVRGYSVRP